MIEETPENVCNMYCIFSDPLPHRNLLKMPQQDKLPHLVWTKLCTVLTQTFGEQDAFPRKTSRKYMEKWNPLVSSLLSEFFLLLNIVFNITLFLYFTMSIINYGFDKVKNMIIKMWIVNEHEEKSNSKRQYNDEMSKRHCFTDGRWVNKVFSSIDQSYAGKYVSLHEKVFI